ncbi:MAG TPA: dTDP-4-dehydrorhamnose 3,5-epimerase [Ancylobacter sp.]
MQIDPLEISGVFLITAKKIGDQRGFFSETFRADVFAKHVVETPFVQDNHVRSTQRGVVRGLHYQTPPHAQGKLVRCTKGAILDVAVDIRTGSPSYGRHVAVELTADNWRQLWVPPGFAHGYATLEEDCEVIYKVSDYYAPDCDRGIAWDDPALGIDWRIPAADTILSDKDRKQPRLAETTSAFQFGS